MIELKSPESQMKTSRLDNLFFCLKKACKPLVYLQFLLEHILIPQLQFQYTCTYYSTPPPIAILKACQKHHGAVCKLRQASEGLPGSLAAAPSRVDNVGALIKRSPVIASLTRPGQKRRRQALTGSDRMQES